MNNSTAHEIWCVHFEIFVIVGNITTYVLHHGVQNVRSNEKHSTYTLTVGVSNIKRIFKYKRYNRKYATVFANKGGSDHQLECCLQFTVKTDRQRRMSGEERHGGGGGVKGRRGRAANIIML